MNSIPREIARLIALCLPVDTGLAAAATASNSHFTQLILLDDSFAREHLATFLMTHPLVSIGRGTWTHLPFTYKCAIYARFITDANYYFGSRITAVYPIPNHAARLVSRLMDGTCIDLRKYTLKVVDFLCANANPEALKLAVVHPNMAWTKPVAQHLFLHTITGNRSDMLEFLLQQTLVIPEFGASADLTHLIESAAQFGHVDLVRKLLSDDRSDPSINDGASLREASSTGNVALTALLLQDTRVHPNPSSPLIKPAIFEATRHGHEHVVKILLADPRTNPSLPNWSTLVRAVHDRRIGIVNVLLGDARVDPAANESAALRIACSGSNPNEELLNELRMNNLPYDVARLIAVRLPVDERLTAVATASNSHFTQLLLFDDLFARSHLTTYMMTHPLETVTHGAWVLLPFAYKCATYAHLIADPSHQLRKRLYPHPPLRSVKIVSKLMNGLCIVNLHQHIIRLIDFLCLTMHPDAVKVATNHPNVVWTPDIANRVFLHSDSSKTSDILTLWLARSGYPEDYSPETEIIDAVLALRREARCAETFEM
ncbi:hypothetical protein CcCBS67573_g05649 [Chytriomyces confervae]|uniref:F-box domain-containing protein n=1 Tax=Chytriomyces confervae TaxID=246404 RepID=A0A507FA98_9FUNG|nr:hypothetical protein CcCBS67573_g05649 [Chytriomyces confervae]